MQNFANFASHHYHYTKRTNEKKIWKKNIDHHHRVETETEHFIMKMMMIMN